MVAANREIESRIVCRLHELVGTDQFEIWFEGENAVRFDGKSVTVVSTSSFAQTRMLQAFQSSIEQAVLELVDESLLDDGKAVINYEIGEIRSEGIEEPAVFEPALPYAQTSLHVDATHASPPTLQAQDKFANYANGESSTNVATIAIDAAARRRLPHVEQPNGKQLRRKIDLSTFEFDESNSLARAAVDQLRRFPGGASPVYFHGPVGCRKNPFDSRHHCRIPQSKQTYTLRLYDR